MRVALSSRSVRGERTTAADRGRLARSRLRERRAVGRRSLRRPSRLTGHRFCSQPLHLHHGLSPVLERVARGTTISDAQLVYALESRMKIVPGSAL